MEATVPRETAESELPAGYVVGEYVVERKIGEGGFGAVFRASHPTIGKLAAIKVLSRKYSSDPEIVSRFTAEARAVNQIRHRNIIDIFSFGQLEDGRSYYVMELLEGETLDKLLHATGGLGVDEAIPILRGIARALDAAHEKGIAHRDLKPENVFLSRDSSGVYDPKLLDFGIAKLFGEQTAMHKTRTGSPIGTPYYMSPEQCRGEQVDHRTDIYSFGILAYQLLTGKLPFDGENHLEILMKQTSDEPVPPSVRAFENPALAPVGTAIDDAIAWMMRKDPLQRPPNLVAAMRALEEAAGVEPTSHLPVSRRTPMSLTPGPARRDSATAFAHTMAATGEQDPPKQKRKTWLMFGGVALALGAGALAFVLMGGKDSTSTTIAQPPIVVQVPAATPAPAPVAEAKRFVTITINGVPEGTEVFGPAGPLGVAPGEIKLLRGSEEVQLVLQAEGHAHKVEKIVPDGDKVLAPTLVLKPQPVATPATVAKPRPRPAAKPTTTRTQQGSAAGSGVDNPYARH